MLWLFRAFSAVSWDLFTGFLYVSSNLLNISNHLTNFKPADATGLAIDNYTNVVPLLLFGIVLNVTDLLQGSLTINRIIQRFVTVYFNL